MAKQSNLFKTLEIEAFRKGINPRTKQSRDWFRQRVQNMRGSRMNRNQLMRDEEVIISTNPTVGNMMMFMYDAKTKDQLPYWDAFPLIVSVGPAEGGFYGLNLHYLPPILRAKMLDALLDVTNNVSYDDTTKFNVTYSTLQKVSRLKYYKPCFKHYLTKQLKSKFGVIQPAEWEIATFLPTADWRKSTANKVYSDSRKMI